MKKIVLILLVLCFEKVYSQVIVDSGGVDISNRQYYCYSQYAESGKNESSCMVWINSKNSEDYGVIYWMQKEAIKLKLKNKVKKSNGYEYIFYEIINSKITGTYTLVFPDDAGLKSTNHLKYRKINGRKFYYYFLDGVSPNPCDWYHN